MADHDQEFQQFVTDAAGVLLRAAVALCRDVATAEDLVQTTFARMARHWPTARAAPLPYARRVLVNLTRDHARQASRRPAEPLAERHLHLVAEADPSAGIDRRLELLRALHELPERQRATVVLRFYLDLSVVETAALLRVAPGTVKSTTSRALERLGHLLADGDGLAQTTTGGNRC